MRRAFVIVAIVLIVLAVTNPTRAEYIEWAKGEALASEDSGIARFLVSTLGGPVLESATEARNYIFFSLFRSGDALTLGILHHFIPLR
jgi:hypothetical protein